MTARSTPELLASESGEVAMSSCGYFHVVFFGRKLIFRQMGHEASKKLRALHISEASLEPLNLDDLSEPIQQRMPPSLEYISWTSIAQNRRQYYRVLREVDPDLVLEYPRLQALPSSFALQSLGPAEAVVVGDSSQQPLESRTTPSLHFPGLVHRSRLPQADSPQDAQP
ncbi:hypothetical protein V8E36_009859 [Tilletia maclaganii]